MAERIRTDWKGRADALAVERDQFAADNLKLSDRIGDLEAALVQKDAEIEELKRAVQRARLEGAKAATESLLVLE